MNIRSLFCMHQAPLSALKKIEDGLVTVVCAKCQRRLYAEYGLVLPVKWIPEPMKRGDIFVLKDQSDNPFAKEKYRVEIKDYKDGWVNYAFLPRGGAFDDESRKVDSFLRLYAPAELSSAQGCGGAV